MKNTNSKQNALISAKEALEKTDKELYPKLYESREATIKALEIAENQKIRAEKAEAKPKKANLELDAPKQSTNEEDLYALIDAKVPREDTSIVKKFAKLEGISITKALESDIVKGILRDKAEERKTAAAANTGEGKRGSTKVSDDTLLSNAEDNKLPESDAEMMRLAEARLESKRQPMPK